MHVAPLSAMSTQSRRPQPGSAASARLCLLLAVHAMTVGASSRSADLDAQFLLQVARAWDFLRALLRFDSRNFASCY